MAPRGTRHPWPLADRTAEFERCDFGNDFDGAAVGVDRRHDQRRAGAGAGADPVGQAPLHVGLWDLRGALLSGHLLFKRRLLLHPRRGRMAGWTGWRV